MKKIENRCIGCIQEGSGLEMLIGSINSLIEREYGREGFTELIEKLTRKEIGGYLKLEVSNNSQNYKFYCPWEDHEIAELTFK